MTGSTKSMKFAYRMPQRDEGDACRYGTLLLIAACLGVLATMFFPG